MSNMNGDKGIGQGQQPIQIFTPKITKTSDKAPKLITVESGTKPSVNGATSHGLDTNLPAIANQIRLNHAQGLDNNPVDISPGLMTPAEALNEATAIGKAALNLEQVKLLKPELGNARENIIRGRFGEQREDTKKQDPSLRERSQQEIINQFRNSTEDDNGRMAA